MTTITGTEIFSGWTGATIMIAPGRAHNGKETIIISKPPATNGDEAADEIACVKCGSVESEIVCFDTDAGPVCPMCYQSEEE